MPTPPETCGACRFDGAQYDLQDARGTLRALSPMWAQTTEGVDDAALDARPAPEVWSATEYAVHSARVTQTMHDLLARALGDHHLTLSTKPEQPTPDPSIGFDAGLERLRVALDAVHERTLGLTARDSAWKRTVTLGQLEVDAAWIVRHVVHDVSHHLGDVGRGLHLLGAGAPTQAGVVAALHASDGGVPKLPVEVAEVGDRGLVGDRQATRKHHGRPLQALCLWSSEVIGALQAEGHPIAPGLAGENITVTGVDWSTIRPGVQLLVGDVLAEISAYAVPCKKNARWFTGGDFNRMSHDRHPGWSRAYAWVREPGTIRSGDPVIVEP
ncbi:MAG: MOSC domain-containing protein [Acidimicrobiales bacterium]